MNDHDLNDHSSDGAEPPTADILAGEYVLGLLEARQRRQVEARIAADAGFARLVDDWEQRLAPLLDGVAAAEVPAHLWPRIRTRLGWPPVQRRSVWQNVNFWRAATGVAAAAALAAVVVGQLPPAPSTPGAGTGVVQAPPPASEEEATRPVTPLLREDGVAGWLASVDTAHAKVLMVPVPAPPDPQGRVPELWLIAPGEPARSLGIVSTSRSHTVDVPQGLRGALAAGSILAITLEPQGGAPQGVATGPVVAKGDIVTL
ncbi:anti-sigma factor [Stenotrophomonas sp. YIM B06876]|uniref:anti-sigma factor n=1 Tax=Stenotrophomonas sp. YIM B06876 TaxID=3060211 RepID=UPI002739081E|nr:anti-sigma factor [Stenotrophomonas sp. YIM B06876]